VLENLVSALMARSNLARDAVRNELGRLQREGYLDEAEAKRLLEEGLEALGERLEAARAQVEPALGELGGEVGRRLRDALDLPSRAEVVALTEALRAAQSRESPPSADPTTTPAGDDERPGAQG